VQIPLLGLGKAGSWQVFGQVSLIPPASPWGATKITSVHAAAQTAVSGKTVPP